MNYLSYLIGTIFVLFMAAVLLIVYYILDGTGTPLYVTVLTEAVTVFALLNFIVKPLILEDREEI